MSNITQKHKMLADGIREAAAEWIRNAREYYPGDEEMIQGALNDGRDLLKVATLVEEGKISEALMRSYALDTIVREEIPEDAWQFMLCHNRLYK